MGLEVEMRLSGEAGAEPVAKEMEEGMDATINPERQGHAPLWFTTVQQVNARRGRGGESDRMEGDGLLEQQRVFAGDVPLQGGVAIDAPGVDQGMQYQPDQRGDERNRE